MNEYDSNRILDLTKIIDYNLTDNITEADCYVLNTCHIREKATDKVYHDIGRIKKQFRNKKKPIVIVTGCVAQAEGDILLQKEKYIDAVLGPQSYQKINDVILKLENKNKKINSTEFEVIEKFDQLNIIKNSNSKISSYLTIQEGCDKFCKFCVVPYTRGPEHSRSISELLSEAKHLIGNGVQEIVLLGQNVNAYNFKNKKLSDLLYFLNEIEGLKRIRYTTSHPRDFTEDLLEAHGKCEKLMPLLHLPIQSGSTKILKSMNRGHTVDNYLEIIKILKLKKPSIKFSSDFIIGYPGETEEDFNKTISIMKKVKFVNSYSFIFSSRPGTPAANLKIVNSKIAKERLDLFQKTANDIKTRYRKELINSKIKVLFENKIKNKDEYFGRDEHFNSVIVKSRDDLTGKIMNITVSDCNQNTLFGKTIHKNNDGVEYAA
tara:strand:- start:1548 stop:2846 length:1299 start_codon:yes stop_codon:yes gene_type:complete